MFTKKNKDCTFRTLANPPIPLRPITSHFCLTHHPPPQSGRHMCITPKNLFISETSSCLNMSKVHKNSFWQNIFSCSDMGIVLVFFPILWLLDHLQLMTFHQNHNLWNRISKLETTSVKNVLENYAVWFSFFIIVIIIIIT